jgi:hypothetical protein
MQQQQQQESLNEIWFNLNEMAQVKDDLKATNEFKPNLSSLASALTRAGVGDCQACDVNPPKMYDAPLTFRIVNVDKWPSP